MEATHAIACLTHIQELILSGNRVLPHGAEMLAVALQGLTALDTRDKTIMRCEISIRAAAALAEERAARKRHMHVIQELGA